MDENRMAFQKKEMNITSLFRILLIYIFFIFLLLSRLFYRYNKGITLFYTEDKRRYYESHSKKRQSGASHDYR